MRKMRNKNYKKGMILSLLLISFIIFILLLTSHVLAFQKLCLGYGEKLPPDSAKPRYTCYHDRCEVCVTDNLYPTLPSRCSEVQGCQIMGNGSSIDSEPPILIIDSPKDDQIFNSRKVLFDLKSNEPTSLYYIDNINGRNKWKRLQSLTKSFNRDISFKDGMNNITIKGVDRNRNEVLVVRKFFVDSQGPRIKSTSPEQGFIGSKFSVEYDEENVKEVRLNYGNSETGTKEKILNNCPSGRKQTCYTEVNLAEFNGQEIVYWFELTDIAGNTDRSDKIKLAVDESAPIIVEFNFSNNDKFAYFSMKVYEPFLSEIVYSYTDDRGKDVEKKLCSKLENDICEAVIKFRDGQQDIAVIVRDRAGNEVYRNSSFFIDTKKPKIKRTEPIKGFANGLFEIEFVEENPEKLILNYGNSEDMRQTSVDINKCENKKSTFCSEIVDINSFNGKNFEYWFYLEDRTGNNVSSNKESLNVDNKAPILINNDFWSLEENTVFFNFNISEDYFAEVNFIDQTDSRPDEKILCNKLVNGMCIAKEKFKKGHHILDIGISDKAGNVISNRIEFDVF